MTNHFLLRMMSKNFEQPAISSFSGKGPKEETGDIAQEQSLFHFHFVSHFQNDAEVTDNASIATSQESICPEETNVSDLSANLLSLNENFNLIFKINEGFNSGEAQEKLNEVLESLPLDFRDQIEGLIASIMSLKEAQPEFAPPVNNMFQPEVSLEENRPEFAPPVNNLFLTDVSLEEAQPEFTPPVNNLLLAEVSLEKVLAKLTPPAAQFHLSEHVLPYKTGFVTHPLMDKTLIREKVIQRLRNLLEQVPPEAHKALTEIIDKFQTEHPGGMAKNFIVDKPDGKTFNQLHFEMSAHMPEESLPLVLPENTPMANNLENIDIVNTDHSSLSSEHTGAMGAGSESISNAIQSDLKVSNPKMESHFADKLHNFVEPPHEQVVKAARLTVHAGKKEIAIQLKPRELGDVRLILNSNAHNEVSAQLITETLHAKETLQKNLDNLVSSLEENGIRLGKITIIQAASDVTPDNKFQQFEQFYQSNDQQNSDSQLSHFNHNSSANHNGSSQSHATIADNSSFKDGGSFLTEDEASSISPFDTEVEGEEVPASSNTDKSLVDIRV